MKTTDIHPKVAGATAGAAAASVLVWLLGQFGIDMPLDIATSIMVVGTLVAGYMTPAKLNKK